MDTDLSHYLPELIQATELAVFARRANHELPRNVYLALLVNKLLHIEHSMIKAINCKNSETTA